MYEYSWNDRFTELFARCLAKFEGGNSDFNTYYSANDLTFLASIGYKPREFFDFIEDHGTSLPVTTALLVAAVRRDYFHRVQGKVASSKELKLSDLPAKDATVDGIRWLPRIIVKARAKLRGEMHPDMMYGCGGDRMFLSDLGIHLADFLEVVWAAGDDDAAIIDYVKARRR